MSLVSVIIPCYKYGHFLRGCVESALSQEGVEVRALIIDDASPDDSAHVAATLTGQDRRVEFRRHEVNWGHIATYNEGLDWAGGDYTLLLSADDLLAPGALLRAARFMDAHPEVGLTYGGQIHFEKEPPETDTRLPGEDAGRVLRGPEFVAWCCSLGSNPVATPTAVVRTSLQKKLGGYRTDLPHTADMELWLRFAVHGDVGVIDAVQAYKRRHARNMQHQFLGTGVEDLRQRQAAFQTLFREFGHLLADAGRLRQQAQRALAEEAFWAASKVFDRGNKAACRELLRLAVSLDPEVPRRPEWGRLRWKRCLGPRVWGVLRPLVDRLRGKYAN
jgi:glycosyltransferase involved in cell wall biosynthesis